VSVPQLADYAAESVRIYTAALPWFLPGLVLAMVLGVPLSGPVAHWLRTRRAVGYLLIVSLGAILAATLPPGAEGFDRAADRIGACDLHRIGLATSHDYLSVSEVSLNVLLFVPLGVAIALLPRTRRTLGIAVAAFLLPVSIEVTQLVVPTLGRACESGDVVDNLAGLLLGLAIGGVGVAIGQAATRMGRSRAS